MEKRSNRNTGVSRQGIVSFIRILIICLLLTVGLAVFVTTLIQNDMERDVNNELTTNHEIAQIQIATQFNNILSDALIVKSITTSTLKYHTDEDEILNRALNIESMYRNIINSTGKYAAISYIGVDDNTQFSAGKPKTDEISQYMIDLYQVNTTEDIPMRAYISRFKYSPETKATTFTVTIPVMDNDGILEGYVVMEPYMSIFIESIKEAVSDASLFFDLLSIEGTNAYYVYSDLHPERGNAYDPANVYLGQTIDNAMSTNLSGSYTSEDGKTFYNVFSIPLSNYTGERHQFTAPGNYVISLTTSQSEYHERTNINETFMFILHSIMSVLGIVLTIILSISSSRRRRLEAKTTRMAQIDTLTGLLNRAFFTENFEALIEDNPESKYAILFMDLDGFKQINDSYGHDMGDKVLHIVANRLVMSARRDDLIARFGGDEFAMLISYNSEDQVKYVANKVVKAVGEPMIIEDEEYQVGVSLGVAMYPDHARTVDELYKISDNAMYRVKYSTKNAYYISKGEDDNH